MSFADDEARLTADVSERLLDVLDLRPGERVLDLACGRGEPALRVAARVGPTGRVVGVDLDPAAIAVARERARTAGLGHATFVVADATHADAHARGFDAATCRWGLAAFPDPAAALAALRRALRPGARVAVTTWADRARVPWWDVPRRVTERFVDLPAPRPDAPGALRFARVADLREALAAAGFAVTLDTELRTDVLDVPDGAALVAWTREVLAPLAARVPPEAVAAWERALAAEGDALRAGGRLRVGGVTHLLVAAASG